MHFYVQDDFNDFFPSRNLHKDTNYETLTIKAS